MYFELVAQSALIGAIVFGMVVLIMFVGSNMYELISRSWSGQTIATDTSGPIDFYSGMTYIAPAAIGAVAAVMFGYQTRNY